jgi:hypothetical protein
MATYPNVRYRLWALASPVFTLVIVAGALSAVLHWHPGAYVAAAGLFGLIASRCAIAAVEYRHVMSRPWPKVAALTDDWD